MAYPGLAHEDHKYLGKEYCTGYTDVYGKWNTGFYCPQYGSKTAVFCCGTTMLKYCCTNQEPTDPNSSSSGVLLDGDDPDFDGGSHHGVSSAVFVRVPIVFGVVCGIAAVLVLLIVASCYFCSCCFAYKKRRNDHTRNIDLPHHHHLNQLHLNHSILHPSAATLSTTGLYRNSTPSTNSSTTSSNLLNLYAGTAGSTAPLTNNSLVTTPLDLDWASSIASAYHQPQQQQLFHPPSLHFTPPPHGPGPSNALSPAAAATLAVALSQQQQQRVNLQQQHHTTPSPNSILPGSGTPSVISGTTLSTGRLPSVSQAYQSFLNSSTSTLSSSSASVAPRGLGPPQPQLHRSNLPQQISSTASIVNSYLASLQSAQHVVQNHSDPPPAYVHPPIAPMDRTRHPSPPPSYVQTVSSSSYHGGSNTTSNSNYNNNGRSFRSGNQNSQRQSRMATIQSILAGGSGSTWSNEDDILLADVLLRHENTLRRSLGLSNNNNNNNNRNYNSSANNNNFNNSVNNSSSINSNSRNRGNAMLTQRELIELLLRLTYHSNNGPGHSVSSTASSTNRSDSRGGSDSHSTTSSVATTRSTTSAASTTSNGKVNGATHPTNCTKLTISEVDEDNAGLACQEGSGGGDCRTGGGHNVTMRNSKAAGLDLSLSRLSVGENDSGVASSTCSTVGSEIADSVIGSIKMISRDLSEEAMKLKKQPHAVDDDGVQDVDVVADEGKLTISSKMNARLHEQQLAATIHPERKYGGAGDEHECTNGVLVPTNRNGGGNRDDVPFQGNKNVGYIGSGSGSDGEIIDTVDRNGNGNTHNGTSTLTSAVVSVPATTALPATIISLPATSLSGGVHLVPSENTISTHSTAQV